MLFLCGMGLEYVRGLFRLVALVIMLVGAAGVAWVKVWVDGRHGVACEGR